MRAEGRQRLGRIGFGRPEAAVVVALEQHHAIAPQAPARQRFAKAFRHRAEVFADHDAAGTLAFLGDDAQQRLERKAHISAVAGAGAVRNHESRFRPST